MTVSELFIKLTEYLIPYKKEYILEHFLPDGIRRDFFGNYYIIIGETKTMFTCHMDNYTTKLIKVNHVFYEDDKGRKKVKTDEKTPLGSDDKAGMTIMLKMIENNVPGCYYFFLGEETVGFGTGGCKGSKAIYEQNKDWFKQFNRCIAFDRHGYGSIISKQRGKECCSKEFVKALASEFESNNMAFRDDPTGRYTDSAIFMYTIPEVTNLSCGGFNEHTPREIQNLDYLERMVNACLKINWESLPTVRVPKEPYSYWEKPKTTTKDWTERKKEKEKEKKETEEPTQTKRKSIDQKKRPNLGFLRYKTFVGKSGEDLAKTIEDYLAYFGYKVYLSHKNNWDAYIGVCKIDSSTHHLILDNPSPFLNVRWKFKDGFKYEINGHNIYITYNKAKNIVTTIHLRNLRELEDLLGVGFAAKFYKFVDSFVTDLIMYSKQNPSGKTISREDVEYILRKYGNFRYEELLENYDKLFDEDDFKINYYWVIV